MNQDPALERILAAARKAGPPWTSARQQRVSWTVMRRSERTRRSWPLVLACATATAMVVLVMVRSRGPVSTGARATVAVEAPGSLVTTLADGSRVVRDGPATVLRKSVEADNEVLYDLDAGGARFEVARRPSRAFRVQAGRVTVQVIGTGFRVERTPAGCQVAVDHGRVLVSWWGGSRELGAGEEGTFPPEAADQTGTQKGLLPPGRGPGASLPGASYDLEPPAATSLGNAQLRQRAPSHPAPVAAPGRAPTRGLIAPVVARQDAIASPDALFARADQARAAGNADAAFLALRELVDRYPRDPHAAPAAFTMGRLLLESLRRPRAAAAAFAEARALAGGAAPLTEDALAREVEALHVAGDAPAARARAELYRSSFPHGLRGKTVARFGGVQADP